jgi:hypothetical protein
LVASEDPVSVFVCLALLAGVPPVAILESHVGARPDDFDRTVEHVVRGFDGRPTWSGDELARVITATFGRAAGRDASADVERLRAQFDTAYDAYINGRLAAAQAPLEQVVHTLLSTSALGVRHQPARETLYRALVVLSHVHARLGHTADARAAMAEVLRTFPDRPVLAATFGGEIAELYRDEKRELAQRPRLALRVDTDSDAVVFINERFIGVGPVSVADLLPGTYRVLTQIKQRLGRVHEVTLVDAQVEIHIDASFDCALESDSYAGLRTPTLARDPDELRAAAQVAGRVGAEMAVILASRPYRGHPALIGTLVEAHSGRLLRAAAVALDKSGSAGDAGAEALGRFLSAGVVTGALVPLGPTVADAKAATAAAPPRTRAAKWLPWVTLTAGVALAAAGGYWLRLDGSGTCGAGLCPERYATGTQGAIAVSTGGALMLGSAGWLYWQGRALSVEVGPKHAGLSLVGAF